VDRRAVSKRTDALPMAVAGAVTGAGLRRRVGVGAVLFSQVDVLAAKRAGRAQAVVFCWLERAAGGGARRGQGLASGGRDLQWQRANRAATARVSMHVRIDRQRAAEQDVHTQSQRWHQPVGYCSAERGRNGLHPVLRSSTGVHLLCAHSLTICALCFMGGKWMLNWPARMNSRRRGQGCRQRPQRFTKDSETLLGCTRNFP
jgi:hypothetical protein